MIEDITKLKQRLQESKSSLNIARLPNKIKEDFVNLSNEEFCGDYGMCFRECFNSLIELRKIKELIFNGEYILNSQSQPKQYETRRLLNGKEIKMKKREEIQNE